MSEELEQIFDIPEQEPKKKTKKKMSDERRAALLENLRKGREKQKAKRESNKRGEPVNEVVEQENIIVSKQEPREKPSIVKDEELEHLKEQLRNLKNAGEKKELRRQIKELKEKENNNNNNCFSPQPKTESVKTETIRPPPSQPIPIPQPTYVKKSLFKVALW